MNQHPRPGVVTTASFVGGLVVVFSVLQVVQQVASAFDPRPVVTALLTIGIALVSALVAHWQSIARGAKAQSQLHRLLAVHPDERPGAADAVALGVFPGKRRRGRTPPYVARAIDDDLRKAVLAATSVVVTGPALAGKSRTALQAVREAAPEATLIAPRGPDELKELLSADPRLQVDRCRRILWLDDLPQYVDTLDQPALDRLDLYFPPPRGCGAEAAITVVATVRDDEWRAMLGATGPAGQLARGLADRASVHGLAPTDDVFRARAASIYPDEAFPDGPGRALATSGMEIELPEPPRPPFESSGPQWWDRTAKLLAGLVALAAVLIVFVLVVSGFSKPTPPAMAAQIGAIERSAAKHGEYAQPVTGKPVDLHGTGAKSEVFLFTAANVREGQPPPSDELRIYDDEDGWLREAFRFRPAEPDIKFELRGRGDIDRDGATEIVGAYSAPDARRAMLPFAIDWDRIAERYALVPLDLGPPRLSDVKLPKRFRVQERIYRERYSAPTTIRDATSARRLTGHRVQELVVTNPPRVVAAYFLRPPFEIAKDPALYEIHAAILAVGRKPSLTPCTLAGIPPPRMEILLSERSQMHALEEAWASASANRYCAVAAG